MLTRIYLTFLSCFSLLFLAGCATEPTNQSPIAVIDASATNGEAPLTVTLSGSRSSDPDGTIVDYRWDLGDGNTKNGVSVTHTYSQAGAFTVKLTVTDNQGASGEARILITARKPDCSRDSADNGRLRLTLRSVSVASEIVGSEPGERAIASQGNKFVIIDVLMEAWVYGQRVDPSRFHLEDEDQVAYAPNEVTYILENPLKEVTYLGPGEREDGKIAFEVKQKVHQLRLIYRPSSSSFGDEPNLIICFGIP